MISLENHSYLLGLDNHFNFNFEVSKNLEARKKALNKEGKWLPLSLSKATHSNETIGCLQSVSK